MRTPARRMSHLLILWLDQMISCNRVHIATCFRPYNVSDDGAYDLHIPR